MTITTALLTKKLAIPADYLFWRSHARFIFENITSTVVAVDAGGTITIFNRAAEKVFNRKAGEVIGRALDTVFPGLAKHEYYLLKTLKSGRECKDVEYTYCPYTGREGVFVHNIALLKGAHREVAGAIWMRKDVTHERRFQKEVSNAEIQAMVSQIAAGTAHEIRNPLTTAKGYIQLARQKCSEQSAMRDYLEMAAEEIDQANRIITDFLALVHPGAEGLQFVCFNRLVEELVLLVENVGTMVNVSVISELDRQVPLCLMDAKLVKQAVLNVLRNAIQAMPQGGTLAVNTSYFPESDEISVSVSDTGEGIRQEDLGRIFTPFFSTRVEGSGLGLTLTNRIVQHHNGRVDVASQEGKGTTVTLVFPVCQQ